MAEKVLKNRRRRASKGKLIRVSDTVFDVLDRNRGRKSWDCLLRQMLGLPDRNGRNQPLVEGILEILSGTLILRLPETSWDELESTAGRLAETMARQKSVRLERPVKMREIR